MSIIVLFGVALLAFVFVEYSNIIVIFTIVLLLMFVILSTSSSVQTYNYDIGEYLDKIFGISEKLYKKRKLEEKIFMLNQYLKKDQIDEISRFLMKKIRKEI